MAACPAVTVTIWLSSGSLRSSSCPASATPEGHQRSSLIRAKYPVTKHCGSKLNIVMIHGFSSSVRSHAANVLPWDRTACGRKGPQSFCRIIPFAVSCTVNSNQGRAGCPPARLPTRPQLQPVSNASNRLSL